MDYVEFLRVRRALIIYAILVAIAAIVTVASVSLASVHTVGANVSITIDSNGKPEPFLPHFAVSHWRVPLGLLFGLAGYAAVTIATVFASSLNKENDGANFVFTKPISRERLALQHMAIDAAGILSAFVIACVAIFGSFAALGLLDHIARDAQALWIAALGLGIGFMWYGIMQAVTASYRGKGGTLVAWSWAGFVILAGVSGVTFLGSAVHALVGALNFFNPIAYFTTLASSGGNVTVASVVGMSLEMRVAIAWCIALVTCALATRIWKNVEV